MQPIQKEADFYQWTREQANLLQAKQFQLIDIDNLIEEITSLGERDKREAKSRLILILTHLLKWQYQPTHRGNSWRRTIIEQRTELALLFDDSPSLRRVAEENFTKCHSLARKNAAKETGLTLATFPEPCPWLFEQVTDPEFWPD